MFIVGNRLSHTAHHDFKFKIYHPVYFSIQSRSTSTEIKPAAASADSIIFVMPEEQMRRAVYYVGICTFWQKRVRNLILMYCKTGELSCMPDWEEKSLLLEHYQSASESMSVARRNIICQVPKTNLTNSTCDTENQVKAMVDLGEICCLKISRAPPVFLFWHW